MLNAIKSNRATIEARAKKRLASPLVATALSRRRHATNSNDAPFIDKDTFDGSTIQSTQRSGAARPSFVSVSLGVYPK